MQKMSTARIARASRSRFFIGIIAMVLMFGFVAIFHSSQQQLEEARQITLRCEQQQEALNVKMQDIIEHKFQLEKSIETERKDHLEMRKKLEKKAKEQKDQHEKNTLESSVRYESLQQHYKLLQSEHNDLVEECEKSKAIYMGQINGLDRKASLLQAQIKMNKQQKEKDVLHWKIKYEAAESERKRLEELLKLNQLGDKTGDNCNEKVLSLEKLISEHRSYCNCSPKFDDVFNHASSVKNEVVKSTIVKYFKDQVPVSDGLYKIEIKLINKTNNMHETQTINAGNGTNSQNVIDTKKSNIINSVENFQIAQKPLLIANEQNNVNANSPQFPPLRAPLQSSTVVPSSSTQKLNKNSAYLDNAATPVSDDPKKSSTRANNKEILKSLRVAPVPDNFETLIKNEENNQSDNKNNNRYKNVVEELLGKKDDTELDNAAREVKDNYFNIGEEKNEARDHLQEVLENMNNAAEEDTNNFFDLKLAGRGNKKGNEAADDEIEMIANKHEKSGGLLEGEDKLLNEVAGDQGKVAFPEGIHMEEAAEEDDDDYYNPAARQQEGHAVRN